MKTNLTRLQQANASLSKVQTEMKKALSELFPNDAKIQVQKHNVDGDVVMVFLSNDVCITMHVQNLSQALTRKEAQL